MSSRVNLNLLVALAALSLGVTPIIANYEGGIAATTYDLSWNTVDGGGGAAVGGTFALTGTASQPDASVVPLTGGTYSLSGGFWPGAGSVSVPTCPPDIVPSGGGDGLVNIDDLLAVISGWGSCPPTCPADITNDNVVNIDDLLAVITNWGTCG
jgi:hypothetical protein